MHCATTLTRSDIMTWIGQQSKIALIKAYRELTGESLMEAKRIIEKFVKSKHQQQGGNWDGYVIDVEGLLKLFDAHLSPSTANLKERLTKGMEAAIDNYAQLGFKNPYEAARMVLDNICRADNMPTSSILNCPQA